MPHYCHGRSLGCPDGLHRCCVAKKWVLLPPGREESFVFDITSAGVGSWSGSCRGTALQPGETESLGSLLGICCDRLGWATVFFCGFLLEYTGYCINNFCFAMLLFSWSFERAKALFYLPLLHFWITGFFSSLSVWYMMQKEKETHHCVVPWVPRSRAGLPPRHFQSFFICFIYNVQGF